MHNLTQSISRNIQFPSSNRFRWRILTLSLPCSIIVKLRLLPLTDLNEKLHFFEFKAGQCRQWVEPLTQGLYVSWKAHNVNKGGELMGMDMLLADGKASINVDRLNTFGQLLNEEALYNLNPLIKPVSTEITESSSPTPTEIYRCPRRSERIVLHCKLEETDSRRPEVLA
ncbi:Uncharacterized protein Rs2_09500 [Raphanus sativus]|nr:Uncharacterized protein Rs2_09500 [Raphanus sativus]